METAYAKYIQETHPRFQETINGGKILLNVLIRIVPIKNYLFIFPELAYLETDVLSAAKVREISTLAKHFRSQSQSIQAFLFSGGAQHWVLVFIVKESGNIKTFFADPVGY